MRIFVFSSSCSCSSFLLFFIFLGKNSLRNWHWLFRFVESSLDFMTSVPGAALWLSNRIAVGIHIQLPDERKMQQHLQSKLEICNLSGWKKVCGHFLHFFWAKFPCGPGSAISSAACASQVFYVHWTWLSVGFLAEGEKDQTGSSCSCSHNQLVTSTAPTANN